MKLITETIDFSNFKVIEEQDDDGNKNLKIHGPFLVADTKNANGRIYSKKICENVVSKFTKIINENRAVGELNHPNSPTINLDRVSHKIESLYMDGKNGIGKAKILDTPMGKIARTLIKEGVLLGVSTRGLGRVDSDGNVGDNYKLITIDIVNDPSAPGAFVNGILENKEYIMDGSTIVEKAVDDMQNKLSKKGSKDILETLNEFLYYIKNK